MDIDSYLEGMTMAELLDIKQQVVALSAIKQVEQQLRNAVNSTETDKLAKDYQKILDEKRKLK